MLDLTLSLEEQCDAIWAASCTQKHEEDRIRNTPPVIKLWDGEWQLQHVISGIEYAASFDWISNDTGPGSIEIPFDHPAAQWVHDSQGRVERGEGRSVHITVEYCETRWAGRLDRAIVETGEDGDDVLAMDFAHDYENLKFYTVWSNSHLPAWFQWPRSLLLGGPVPWILLTALQLQLVRENNPLATIPDDPLDWDLTNAWDQSNWPVVVRPRSFSEWAAAGVVWGVVSSRFATWHDMAKTLLEDSELSVTCTRWLDGDPAPWDGANLRHGTLIIDIEDKSGVHIGTANGGTVYDGLRRTAAEFAEDFIDSTENLIDDTEFPQDYYTAGAKYTVASHPFAVYRTGDGSGIESSRFINSPAKAVQVLVGGHSMPGVVCGPPGQLGGPQATPANTSERSNLSHHSGYRRPVGQPAPHRRPRRLHRHPPQTAVRRHDFGVVGEEVSGPRPERGLVTLLRTLSRRREQGVHDCGAAGFAGRVLGNQNGFGQRDEGVGRRPLQRGRRKLRPLLPR